MPGRIARLQTWLGHGARAVLGGPLAAQELWWRIPFLLHFAVEVPAAWSFLFHQETQLSPAALARPEVRLLVSGYGAALQTTAVIAAAVGLMPAGSASRALRRAVGAQLGLYHLQPIRRAYVRLTLGDTMPDAPSAIFGGPAVHLVVHIVCFALLMSIGVRDCFYP